MIGIKKVAWEIASAMFFAIAIISATLATSTLFGLLAGEDYWANVMNQLIALASY